MFYRIIVLVLMLLFLAGCKMLDLNDPNNDASAAKANVNLGFAFLKQGFAKEAKQKFLYAKKLDVYEPAVWYGIAYWYEVVGNYAAARSHYEKAISLNPLGGAAHNNFGAFLCRIKQYEVAMQQFDLAVKDDNYLDMGVAYENAGICALHIKDKNCAREYFIKALKFDSALVYSKLYLGQRAKVSL
ncbi:MAG: tetratricopeptide repeat protein [Gammaproteobacteria bacterium]|nr:tetratricopeptide repeat protein [Gammaproteobacteria bacterium]